MEEALLGLVGFSFITSLLAKMEPYLGREESDVAAETISTTEKVGRSLSCMPPKPLECNVDSEQRLYGFLLARDTLQRASYIFKMCYSHSSHSRLCFIAISSIMVFLLTLSLFANCASFVFTAPITNGPSTYALETEAAVDALQKWYNTTSGLWDTTGWWNSANALTMLADLVAVDPSMEKLAKIVFPNTFAQAQEYNLQQLKIITPSYVDTFDKDHIPKGHKEPPIVNPRGYVNEYYDDEAWWALAWLKVYDHTHKPQYLTMAEDIFADLLTGYNATCGGIWWNKAHTQNGAIENELFISVAAHLANRAAEGKKPYYLSWAQESWSWFRASGMINAQYTINNGLDLATCKNDGGTVWSYNQGVILGALVELNTASPNPTYLTTAKSIATAAIAALSDANGILHDPCEPNCGNDGPQFKGVFMRNLQVLQQAAPVPAYKTFIDRNADSIWAKARSGQGNLLGLVWSGPFDAATASTQSSALDALVAAVAAG